MKGRCCFVAFVFVLFLLIQHAAANIEMEITNFKGSYCTAENLTGEILISFTEFGDIPKTPTPYLNAYLDGELYSGIDMSGLLPQSPGDLPYKKYPFGYNITGEIRVTWYEYPAQEFSYSLMVEGTCGNAECAGDGDCDCPCGPPYECEWSDTIVEDKDAVIDGSENSELIYDSMSSVSLPGDNNEKDLSWKVKCRNGDYSESCGSAPGLDGTRVQLTMRQSCEDSSSGGGLWIEQSITDLEPCNTDVYSGCTGVNDWYRFYAPFDGASLDEGYTAYGGPTQYSGGIYKIDGGETTYQKMNQSAYWDYETGLVVIFDYDYQASYIINRLPANGPELCAYTDYSEQQTETHAVSRDANVNEGRDIFNNKIECSYDSSYEAEYSIDDFENNLFADEFKYCTGEMENCEQEIRNCYAVETSDSEDAVVVSPGSSSPTNPPVTVSGVTSSQEMADAYLIEEDFSTFVLASPISTGEHDVIFKIENSGTVLKTGSFSFMTCNDLDRDGYCAVKEGGNDCDDRKKDVHPEAVELCDYLDNDCDGVIDEGFDAGENCGKAGVCEGVLMCTEDKLGVTCSNTLEPGDLTEICDNGKDDDCDYIIDESGIMVDGKWQNCTYVCKTGDVKPCGTNAGICIEGYQICSDGEWSECLAETGPEIEVCNTLDDDCDGIVDNVNGGKSAEESKCWCYGGNDKRDENDDPCNDIDDDCDGKIDEGLVCCTPSETRECGTDTGACEKGVQTCKENGRWGSCVGETGPTTEICYDLIDNDCDGATDENCNPEETCFNGKQDLNEDGVDCGGACDKPCNEFSSWMLFAILIIILMLIFFGYNMIKQ